MSVACFDLRLAVVQIQSIQRPRMPSSILIRPRLRQRAPPAAERNHRIHSILNSLQAPGKCKKAMLGLGQVRRPAHELFLGPVAIAFR